MQTFDFPFHRVADEYPESSSIVKFGGGYEFASKPRGPDQITFKLAFPAMWFFETAAGSALDLEPEKQRNMGVLQAFYEEHRLYEKFVYPHPRRGNVVCRFKKPLAIPDGVAAGNGIVQAFTVELTLQP